MKGLKDIKLKKGDIVHYINSCGERSILGGEGSILGVNRYAGCSLKEFEAAGCFITKVERPKYETIYEAPKEILDKEEKAYLEAVIRPFKNRVTYIVKQYFSPSFEYLEILLTGECHNYAILPKYKYGTMYKGMEPNKEYTLDELGLFKEVATTSGEH